MSALLHRVGTWCAIHARRTLAAWIVVLAVLGSCVAIVGPRLDNTFRIRGAESLEGMAILQERLPEAAGTSEPVLFTASDGQIRAHGQAVRDFVTRARQIQGIAMVTDPLSELTPNVSTDGAHALVQVMGDRSVGSLATGTTPAGARVAEELRDLIAQVEADHPEVDLSLGGNIGHSVSVALSTTELVGVGVAAIVLMATFGSLLAAGAPLVAALIGVGTGMLGILVTAAVVDINSTTPVLAVMIGLAVGIDYALFIISRAREYLARGVAPVESAARAVATAGSAVVFAGGTVVVALCGLAVTGIDFLATMGFSAAAVVAVAILVALTAVPAMLGLIGSWALTRRSRLALRAARARVQSAAAKEAPLPPSPLFDLSRRRTTAHWWVATITRFPALTTALVAGVLLVLTLPVVGLSTGLTDNGYEPVGSDLRTTYDRISAAFGPGANSPVIVIADIVQSDKPLEAVAALRHRVEALDGVARVQLAVPNPDASLAFIQVIPEGGQTAPSTTALVAKIRSLAGIWEEELGIRDVMVTGQTAVAIDVSDRLAGALLPFGAIVVGLSVVLLTIVFRSVAVPVTATIGYLFSLGAGLGAVGAVFGWGWFSDLLQVTRTGAVISFMPVIVMGVLFGLAMDYEVFLVSRMREEWIHTGDARAAVVRGFTGSASVVTSAAVIMTAVFASFVPHGSVQVKPIALALTVGIAVDAFLVRMTLVPALMAWMGGAAWWIPSWLECLLPVVDVEGEGLARRLEHADWVARHGVSDLRLENVRVDDDGAPVLRNLSLVLPPGTLGVVRSDDRLQRSVIGALVTARLMPSGGTMVVGDHVLPDGVSSIQALSALIDRWDDPLPDSARVVLVDDPGSRRWERVGELLDEGRTVLVTGPVTMRIPSRFFAQEDLTVAPAPTRGRNSRQVDKTDVPADLIDSFAHLAGSASEVTR
ncbi:MMPL family transporter [Schaalia sp. 19OD2882]|uniref:MMPL family transporter n=1 Tax=Schaalia sp. 19OD2882 TaxID=2794089 RepID=UPI001C1EC411|nr:MMPL family transporter [Schaalia sp. 19OD2882]QWW19353.1 MMPL family transporter [Schaalia sp. 19OD2882]